MKGILSIVGILVISGLGAPALAQTQASMAPSPNPPADTVGTVKTVNAKTTCHLHDAEPVTIQAIGNNGQPLPDTTMTLRLRNPRGNTRLIPASADQILSQEKNRLVLKTDNKGQAAIRFSKDAEVGKYPLVVQTSNQEFNVNAVCLGLRTDYSRQLFWLLVSIEILLLLSLLSRFLIFRRTEKILVISDLHGNEDALALIAERLRKHKVKAVIMAGNLTDGSANALTYAQRFVDLVQNQFRLPLFLIHGDREPATVVSYYQQTGHSIHLQALPFSDYLIYGLGGVEINVPELQLPKEGRVIYVSRIPTMPANSRAPFVQITGHAQSNFSAQKAGSTLVLDCPPALLGQAAILHLPSRAVSFIQAPIARPAATQGSLAWR